MSNDTQTDAPSIECPACGTVFDGAIEIEEGCEVDCSGCGRRIECVERVVTWTWTVAELYAGSDTEPPAGELPNELPTDPMNERPEQ